MQYTKISVDKEVNRRITLICARLGLHKTKLLEKLSKVPSKKIEELINSSE